MTLNMLAKCLLHPRYLGRYRPRSTKKYPGGCETCWMVYKFNNGGKL